MKNPVAAVPFLLIPYDSLTHLLGFDPGETSQTLPATAIFSILYLLVCGHRLRFSAASARVFRFLLLAALCIFVVTLANIVLEIDDVAYIDKAQRLPQVLRQGVSLSLGLASYLMFQDALMRIGWQAAARWIVLGTLPSLVLCSLQLMLGSFRIQGFSSEPSQLSDMLVLAFLPACLMADLRFRQRVVLASGGIVALLAAFSGTGIMKAAFALFSYFAVRGRILYGTVYVAAALALVYRVLLFFPDNYIFFLFSLFTSFLESGTLVGGSFIDRYFGFAAPLGMLSEVHGWVGFGLGGDTVYFDRIFDEDVAAAIRLEKSGIASITSLQAKMLLYGGVLGYSFYLAAWWEAWSTAPRVHAAKFMIPTVLAASVFGLGPLFLPYVWLWLAIGATVPNDPK